MRPSRASQGLFLLTTLTATSNALQILSSSPCSIQCGNVLGSTSGDELVCFDDNYGSSKGVVFENCMNCLLTSKYAAEAAKNVQQDSDIRWLLCMLTSILPGNLFLESETLTNKKTLDNLRYTISWCLFGFPNNTQAGDTPCTTR